MSDRATGWLFVAVQAILLVALVLLPGADHWPRPDWLRTAAAIVLITGGVLIGVSALGLGRSLTATPVPVTGGELRTSGLYRFARHPIYSGVLAVVVAIAIRSGSFVVAILAAVTVGFFTIKARWEEDKLTVRYPDYARYAARTPRFVPHPGRWGFRPDDGR